MEVMKIFELHFNPPEEEGDVFEITVHQPTNIYEKRGGTLFLAGELEKSVAENKNFLKKINQNIKKNYYSKIKNPEKALSNTIKSTNKFLAEQIKKENVHWLGNLNFAVFSIKNSELFYTKTGSIKTLLIRAGEITDLSQNFDNQEIEPYPLKVFLSMINGKLAENDLIIILNKKVYDLFEKEGILNKLKKIADLNENNLKKIIPSSLREKGIAGFSLLIYLKKDEEEKKIIKKKKAKKTSFSKYLFPKKLPGFLEKGKLKKKFKNKKLALIALLIFLIFFGFFLRQRRVKKYEEKISYFEEKITQAKELENPDPALRKLLKEADDKEITTKIKDILYEINNLVNIEPKLLATFDQEIKEIAISGNNLYLLFEDEICSLEKECIRANYKTITPFAEGIIAFSDPENMAFIKNNELKEISIPPYDFSFNKLYSYYNNLYFLDKNNCSILFYPYSGNLEWQSPDYWIKQDKECSDLTIDGSIWTIKNDSIDLFYRSEFKENFTISTFPDVNKITQIKTKRNLDYIYFLDPEKERIIITDKKIKIAKQFQSEKFGNLSGLATDGEKIWVANNNKVYEVISIQP